MDLLIIYFGMLVGLIVATVMPYLRKLHEGKIEEFELKYFKHLIITAIWQFATTLPIFLVWTPPVDIVNNLLVVLLAFCYGFGGSEFQKEVYKYIIWLRG